MVGLCGGVVRTFGTEVVVNGGLEGAINSPVELLLVAIITEVALL